MKKRSLAFAFFSALAPLAACGGATGDAVRPKDLTGAAALGGPAAACVGEPKFAQTLVVDLDPSARVDLEAAMREGVVAVAYDCKTLRILPSCKLSVGNYAYAGVSPKEQVVKMTNQDELGVNLPLSAGKLGAELRSGNSIDLALVFAGKRSTTVESVERDALKGGCDGATHFIQSATLGAYAMTTGSAGKVMAAAELFKIGTSGSSSSSRNATTTDGSIEACRDADPEAPNPASKCKAALNLQLQPIGAKAAAVADAKPARGDGKAKPQDKESKPQADPCPPGFALSGGVCTRSAEAPHLCKPDNPRDCQEQCDKGSAESCYNFASNRQAAGDRREEYYKRACDGGFADGCGWYGEFRWNSSLSPKSPENKQALEFAAKGCAMGGPAACDILGDIWGGYNSQEATPGAYREALRAYERSCSLGDPDGCAGSAVMYQFGHGVARDELKAIGLMDRACYGGNAFECHSLGEVLTKSRQNADPERAMRALKYGCAQNVDVCVLTMQPAERAGRAAEGFAMVKSGCDRRPVWCGEVGDLYAEGKGVEKDLAKAKIYWQRGCEAEVAESHEPGRSCEKTKEAEPTQRKIVSGPKPKLKPKRK